MDLLISENGKVFNTEAVQKGYLVSAKHKCWDEPKNGIISIFLCQSIGSRRRPMGTEMVRRYDKY